MLIVTAQRPLADPDVEPFTHPAVAVPEEERAAVARYRVREL
jgi:hypothetical protein